MIFDLTSSETGKLLDANRVVYIFHAAQIAAEFFAALS